MPNILFFDRLTLQDIAQVGGKNASLGELIGNLTRAGVRVPDGFAITAEAYRHFLAHNQIESLFSSVLDPLDVNDVEALSSAGKRMRNAILEGDFSAQLIKDVRTAYDRLMVDDPDPAVAVRSSATAEDLPQASFAGQQDTLLNIRGIDQLFKAIKTVFASLFTDRAISYRVHHRFEHKDVALSVGIQRMVHAASGVSGVMFTLDTESGCDRVVLITASYGLGESVVQGSVNPDEFYLYKPNLRDHKPALLRKTLGSKRSKMVYMNSTDAQSGVTTIATSQAEQDRFCINDADLHTLAQQALLIENHYGRAMDIEWAKDGESGKLYILQARPETVASRHQGFISQRFIVQHVAKPAKVLVTGRSVGQRVNSGVVRVMQGVEEMAQVEAGDVLVVSMTDPDWEPVMKRAAAIITDKGGRTCHAAIIARELGIPAIVGCGNATQILRSGQTVTVSCAEGDTGLVYEGRVPFEARDADMSDMPELPFKIMLNVANPDRALTFSMLPNAGVGLARLEFIINRMIGIHPQALLDYEKLSVEQRADIDNRIRGYASPCDFYMNRLTEGIATIAAAFAPKPVIVRLSDFKSNEYRNLVCGPLYEPEEENPMLGFRGAARYIDDRFHPAFAMECTSLMRVRDILGLTNIQVMIPFVRKVAELQQVLKLLAEHGLERGKNGLKIIMMCEIPTNALLAESFLEYCDGFSIGSNDLTQLTLGIDRDSGLIAHLFDERDPAVYTLLRQAIRACKTAGKYVGICGQGPSDYPDFASWLMDEKIDSVSLNPDSVLDTWTYLAKQ